MNSLNENFMDIHNQLEAQKGLSDLVRTNLVKGVKLYRFASIDKRHLWYAGSWWLGFSPFESLKKYARARKQSLSFAARQCLAIDEVWSDLDLLIEVTVNEGLLAWSGSPKTQPIKHKNRYIKKLFPDRDITQLYIPGLGKPSPLNIGYSIWQSACINLQHSHLGNQ